MSKQNNIIKICKSCSKDKWYPATQIPEYNNFLKSYIDSDFKGFNAAPIIKNISYNLQYVEYLFLTLKQVNLSSVLFTQTIKTIIITGCGIVEAILYYIMLKENIVPKSEKKEVREGKSQEFTVDNDIIVSFKVFRKVEKFDKSLKEIKAKNVLDIVCRKTSILNKEVEKNIKKLLDLRNKVHLQNSESVADTDYINFNYSDAKIIQSVIYEILNNDKLFDVNLLKHNSFYYLKP